MTAIRSVNGETRLYAVIGDPVAQVRTPELINPVFAAKGHNILALPFHAPPGDLTSVMRLLAAMPNVAGAGITIPHKIAAARLCDRLTRSACAVGAINTLRRETDGSLTGALFDGISFVQGLGQKRDLLKGAEVLLVGAGGAGRAIAHALASEGLARLVILDSDPEAAAVAVATFNTAAGEEIAAVARGDEHGISVVINATPVGLKAVDEYPVSPDVLGAKGLVADIASFVHDTPFLRSARERGHAVSTGEDMLGAQVEMIAEFVSRGL